MSTIQPADHQPNDRFGYSCYALVIPAPASIADRGAVIEREAGMTRAKIPAHITVKGTFYGVDSLEEVKRRVEAITAGTPAFAISFEGAESHWGESSGYLSVPVTAEMQALHDALVAAISPLGTAAYQDDPYHAHMTYVQSVSPEGLQRARQAVEESDFGDGFTATAVDLMGRAGPAQGGTWQLIKRFLLGG
jgi:hypothetical protein